jgi:hypothetical protein
VDGLHGPTWLELPGLVLLLVANIEEEKVVATVEPRKEFGHLEGGHRGRTPTEARVGHRYFESRRWAQATARFR